jgi:hypothetical protein
MSRVSNAIVLSLGMTAVVAAVQAANAVNTPPQIPGLEVKVGQTVVIHKSVIYANMFQFADGRISVGWALPYTDAEGHRDFRYNCDAGKWSTDGGHTWKDGPAPPINDSIELGNNEVLSLGWSAPVAKRSDGKYTLPIVRSLDGWKTVTKETAVFDIPRSVPCGSDNGSTNSGFILDHSIVKLRDGRLMTTAYGNYDTDRTPGDRFPASYKFRKYRSIALFSSDKGRTWGNPVTIATAADVAVAQEGPDEPGVARAANGDLLCVMRTGGTLAFGPATPMYLARSTDEGQIWSKPQKILDRGTWPNLCVMHSGIVVCVTSRPDNWLLFSEDNGHTWKGAFNFAPGSSYNSLIEVAPDTILVCYGADSRDKNPSNPMPYDIVGTFFTVKRR